MTLDTFNTITAPSQGIYKEKGSKFIARAFPVKQETEAKSRIQEVRKEFFDARHHCFAYCLGPDRTIFRVNDDGEPSGTAGKPIFGQIQSKNLTNVLIVVVRYFGGIKLGKPGLINAYRTAAKDSLENASIITRTVDEVCTVSFEYRVINDIMRILKEEAAGIQAQDFTDTSCSIRFHIRKSSVAGLQEKFRKLHPVTLDFTGLYDEHQ